MTFSPYYIHLKVQNTIITLTILIQEGKWGSEDRLVLDKPNYKILMNRSCEAQKLMSVKNFLMHCSAQTLTLPLRLML